MALVITVAQQKGGAGKTSLAAHLSAAWAGLGEDAPHGQHFNVVALDLDPQESLTRWFEIRSEKGLPGSLTVRRAADWRISGELLRAKREADIVVLDLPPGTENFAPQAFRAADLVVIPLQLSPVDLWATGPTVDMTRKSGSHPLLVLNRVPARASLNDAVIAEARKANWPMARASLGNRVLFASSLMSGRGVTEEAPASLASAELRLLAREIIAVTRSFARAA